MEKLKILLISHGILGNTSGVGKVHYELREEYLKMGHHVETLDMMDLYPNGQSWFSRSFGKLFTYRIWLFLKKNASRFDIIDANYEAVVYSKKSYNFKGLVIARSHGFNPFYVQSEQSEPFRQSLNKRQVPVRLKTRIGNIYRMLYRNSGAKEFLLSLKHADIAHCLNTDEYQYLKDCGLKAEQIALIPNGLLESTLKQYNTVTPISRNKSLAFVGSWTHRKGINDFEEILSFIKKRTDVEAFWLLGTGYTDSYIKTFFSNANEKVVKAVPRYPSLELSNYLKYCKVGIFPSYIEGFGLAIVEQLACGVPVVAYNVSGPKDILNKIDPSLLIELGDCKAFAAKVVEIMEYSDSSYLILSDKCKQAANEYSLSKVANKFLNTYYQGLKVIDYHIK